MMVEAGRTKGWFIAATLLACSGAQREVEAPEQVDAVGAGTAAAVASDAEAAPVTPAPPSSPADGAVEEAASKELPMTCEKTGDLCLPPRHFARRLCKDAYPGAAIRLFEKSSPFTRAYVRVREMQAINTLGGPAGEAKLTFGEEVLILTRTGGPEQGDMQVSGMGGYDVLRWDGTCATLADGELARRPPITPRHAPFAWQYIDTSIQEALLANQAIDAARKTQRKHCQGASFGRRSASCVQADAKLNERIVVAVRTGMPLPDPDRLP